MTTERIPLFPLDLVLFPEMPLPLHIFESRYKLMIQQCVADSQCFGVVLSRSETLASTGCTARIAQIVREHEDGRVDILVVGQRRFVVQKVHEELPYLEALVEYYEEFDEPDLADTNDSLLSLYAKCHEILYAREPSFPPTSGSRLSYLVASELPLDVDFKQSVLETRSEAKRRGILISRMTAWLPELLHRDRVRRRAHTNGHGLTG